MQLLCYPLVFRVQSAQCYVLTDINVPLTTVSYTHKLLVTMVHTYRNVIMKRYQVNGVVEWILPEVGHAHHRLVGVGEDVSLKLKKSERKKITFNSCH
jgi:hypothetical protein